ncbi:MAG TPA: DUF3488 domain-containing protein, partial [Acidimicrobiales bacterium]|nr:DUF3488 domain-containing protein [Acidimicrobiales bacterium]
MSDDGGRRPRLRVPAELALVAVSLAAVYGFTRLFSHHDRLWRLVVVVLAAHALAVGCRLLRWSLPRATLVSAVGLLLVSAWLHAPDQLWYGLPNGDTFRSFSSELDEAWTLFQDVNAPTAPRTGFLIAASTALWVGVFLADWAAFRLNAAFEAVVPATGLFVFAAILGEDEGRFATTAFLLVFVIGFLLVHRVARQEATARWLATETGRGTRAMLRAGGALAALAIVGGLVVGSNLPGAHDPALIAVRDGGDGPGSRVTISPLVDIKARLVEQRTVEVFTVRSPVPSYWRLTALDSFDGEVWGSGASFERVEGPLPTGASPARRSRPVEQQFDIEALSAIWLPAAFEPATVEADGFEVRWEPSSATLIVDADRATSDETTYRVVSSIPDVTATQLMTA